MNETFDYLCKTLRDRTGWEDKQRTYDKMRNEGLPRRNKPYANAADLHYALIDRSIAKWKPYFFQQIFSGPRICEFVSQMEGQPSEATEAAADYFDYVLKQETNFWREMLLSQDRIMQRGRFVMKVLWDEETQSLKFLDIDPFFMVVPKAADDLVSADCFAQVKHLTKRQYLRLDPDVYNTDEAFVKRIVGGEHSDSGDAQKLDEKDRREGLTYSNNEDTIILWEMWEKTRDGWKIEEFSPLLPKEPARKSALNNSPWSWQGRPLLPFHTGRMEIKDKGWFAARGLAERLAPAEAYGCKVWSSKADLITLVTNPYFTSEETLQNTGNIKFAPFSVLPKGVKRGEMGQMPVDFDVELNNVQSMSEQTIGTPDAGIAPEVGKNGGGGKSVTATQVNFQQTLASAGVELNGFIHKNDVAPILICAWAILVAKKPQKLSYLLKGKMKQLDPRALHDQYVIQPSGSSELWNKESRRQRADARFVKYTGNQFVNQEELVKADIEADDPRLVEKLFLPANVKSASEIEEAGKEIGMMLNGFGGVQVNPADDHQVRIQTVLQFLQEADKTGFPVITPRAEQLLQEYLAEHYRLLQEANPEAARQLQQQFAPPPPPNAVPMPTSISNGEQLGQPMEAAL